MLSDAKNSYIEAQRAQESEQEALRQRHHKGNKSPAWSPSSEQMDAMQRCIDALHLAARTPQELQILVLWMRGKSQPEIGDALGVSQAAVAAAFKTMRRHPLLAPFLVCRWRSKSVKAPLVARVVATSGLHRNIRHPFAAACRRLGVSAVSMLEHLASEWLTRHPDLLDGAAMLLAETTPPRKRTPLAPEENAVKRRQALELWQTGAMSQAEIAAELGHSLGWTLRLLRSAGASRGFRIVHNAAAMQMLRVSIPRAKWLCARGWKTKGANGVFKHLTADDKSISDAAKEYERNHLQNKIL
jgi:predicted transcriptional regulator